MNIEDLDIVNAERDSDPVRFRSYDPSNDISTRYEEMHPRHQSNGRPEAQASEAVEETEERPGSVSSRSSVDNDGNTLPSTRRPSYATSAAYRMSTRRESEIGHYLDRHPTAIKRIQEHRLQHVQTVGSRKPYSVEGVELPSFGGSKPYPPPLPEREEYVVEFDGIALRLPCEVVQVDSG